MRVQSDQPYNGFRIRIAELVDRSQQRTHAVVREMIAQAIARQEQITEQRRADANAEWLGRVLDEYA